VLDFELTRDAVFPFT